MTNKKNISKMMVLISSGIMLICLLFNWLSSETTMAELEFALQMADAFGGGSDSSVAAARAVYNIIKFRWVLIIPMAYPVAALFLPTYNKLAALISTAVTAGLDFIFLCIGKFSAYNAAPFIFLLGAIVAIVGIVELNSLPAGAPYAPAGAPYAAPVQPMQYRQPPQAAPFAQPGQPARPAPFAAPGAQPQSAVPARFCGNCGTRNDSGNRFCLKCGAPMDVPAPTAQQNNTPNS